MDFKTLLKKDFVIFDGAMGTQLQKCGMKPGEIPEMMNFEHPDWVEKIMKSYIAVGSDMVSICTFGANRYKLSSHCDYTPEQVIIKAAEIGKRAVAGTDTLLVLDVAPIGKLLAPAGTMSFDEAYDIFKEIALAAKKAGVDVIGMQTMPDLHEMRAAILAFKENTNLPIIASMTFERGGRTFTGCGAASAAITLEALGVDAIGVNCSLAPFELYEVVEDILKNSTLPLMVKPNAGLPDPITGEFSIGAEEFSEQMMKYADMGVKIFGGCCGTNPEFISLIREKLSKKQPVLRERCFPSAVCSGSTAVYFDCPRIIGERINPTGKKLFKEALKRGDIDYILAQGIEQVGAGAEILDVNVGMPDVDEVMMMKRVVTALQGTLNTPLQLDSTNPEVLEAALRLYNGKPIINSVNAEEKSLSAILPLVKKYGAAVVGLTLDENGIPKKAEQRVALAEKILNRALSLGIRRENILIDCLTLTASAEQEGALETLKAVKIVTEKLGLKTVLGVSNISFGLPARELVNHTFLSMALTNGLTLPIMNPNIASMTGVVRAFRVLSNYDTKSLDFIAAYGGEVVEKKMTAAKDITVEYAITAGMRKEARTLTEAMLQSREPLDIINGELIPILDRVGENFEKGKIFLPQLMLSADTAGVCFDVIKEALAKSDNMPESKGKIILATVKGDIHDIGKNIVKVILANYGYDVIDLGKDVPEQLVVDTAIRENVKLIGLSALMTTTLGAMENTIKLLRLNNVDCKVMVGGAVLTADYAEKIGADFYSRDAKEGVDIAKRVFGK